MMTNGWQVYRVGDLLTQNSNNIKVAADKSYKLLGISLEGRGAFLREEKTGDSISAPSLSPVHAGDFIYSRLFAWRGAFDVVSQELDGCFVSNEFPTFKINTEILVPKFLRLYFNRKMVWEEVEKYCTGTTKASRNRFKEQFFLGMEVPLPPLTEQRRIVEHIESLARRVSEAQSLREEAEIEANVISVSARNQVFGELQKSVEPVRFDAIADMRLGKMLSEKSKTGLNSKLYLRNANIQWDRLDLSSVYEMDFSEEEKPTFRLRAGDILVCEGGDIGKSAIWNDELPECYYQKALHRVRVDRNKTLPRFILYHIFWAAEQGHFADLKTQTTIPHLTGVKLKAYNIYLPPLDEQRRIVAYLDGLQAKVNELRELQSRSGEELSALMPSVLDKAFKGEL